jgi:signal transduction histidine kinase
MWASTILLLAAGRTWVESVPGDGAIFRVWLPREPAAGLAG